MELARNIAQTRRYGPPPGQEANLNRILDRLTALSLSTTGQSFYAWCQSQASRQREPLELSDIRTEGFSQDLLEAFIELGAQPERGQNLADEDPLERYRSVPLHAIFLYTSEDREVSSYILDHWDALDAISGTICDIHPILEQFQRGGSAYAYLKKIDILREAEICDVSQLPGIFFWDHAGQTAYLPFGMEAMSLQVKRALRVVFAELQREPTLASVQRASEILAVSQS